jgi:hypothetical protein
MAEENVVAPEILEEAKVQGWVDKEEFRGPAEEWTDAETFVQRGRQINPILRKNNAELKRELEKANRKADEAIEAAKEFREFQKETFAKKEKEFKAQIDQLKLAKKEAITQGDGERAVAIDDAIDDIKEEQANLKPPKAEEKKPDAAPQIDPELSSWLDRNTWYGKDETSEETELTNAVAASLRRKNPTLLGRPFLDELDKRLTEREIVKGRKKPATPVEGAPNTRPSGGKGHTFQDLPADAKAAFTRFKKQGLMKTEEEYLSNYEWD